jgi:hypothetical protein
LELSQPIVPVQLPALIQRESENSIHDSNPGVLGLGKPSGAPISSELSQLDLLPLPHFLEHRFVKLW